MDTRINKMDEFSSVLENYVGKEIIRTSPVNNNNWGFTSDEPIKFLGLNEEGCIRYQYTGHMARMFGTEERVLSKDYSDSNWILFSDAVKPQENNPLNKWIGKRIKRIRPASNGDTVFMSSIEASILIAATSSHVYIECYFGKRILFDSRYAKPEDWELAE